MIITLSGTPGSGKTTLGKIIAKKLGYEFLSMGDIRRQYAKDKGITLEELNRQAITNPESDHLVDKYQKELSKNDKLVIDSRLAYFFIPKSFKIYIDASDEVRAKRIFSHARKEESYNDVKAQMLRNRIRKKEDSRRYQKLYGILDYSTKSNFDLLLDSSKKTPEELLTEVENAINLKNS